MPTLHVELDPAPDETPPAFSGDTAPLVYFLSFAFAARYGAEHELSQLATLLQRRPYEIDLRPLLTFADRDAEDASDERDLARVWQDGGPLAACCQRVVTAIDADPKARELLRDFPTLRDRLAELGRLASWAAERGARVRVTYSMD